jgi:hypothetical protein
MKRRTIFKHIFSAIATIVVGHAIPVATTTHAQASAFWLGEYFNNTELSGKPALLRSTRNIIFNWGTGSPSRVIRRDNFSVRWTRPIEFPTGTYNFFARVDDGVRVFVDDRLVIDDWREGPARDLSAEVGLSGLHIVRVEYFERSLYASIRFSITPRKPSQYLGLWKGEFFNNPNVLGEPIYLNDYSDLNFDWTGGSPNAVVPTDNFSARFQRDFALAPDNYDINLTVDDGARVYINDALFIDEWREGAPRSITRRRFMSGNTRIRVEYFDRGGNAQIKFNFARAGGATSPTATPIPNFTDWRGEYFQSTNLDTAPRLIRNDREINFDWGNSSPAASIPNDYFAARWTRSISLAPGSYRVTVRVDDGARVYINGKLGIDSWFISGPRTLSADVNSTGSPLDFRVEYFEATGGASIQFAITPINTSFPEWKAEYFNNPNLGASPVLVRNDKQINFDWALSAPAPQVPDDNFSVRWTRRQFFNTGTYRIDATMDDGLRVYVDNVLVLDQWFERAVRSQPAQFGVNAGDHDVRVEFFERGGGAIAKMDITQVSTVNAASTPAP